MGQRHQYIVIYPKMYLNKGNCNNKPMRAEVIHHQWLYGRSAILALWRVLRLANNAWDGDGSDYLFGRSDGHTGGEGTSAISAAISVDPDEGYYHGTHPLERDEYPQEKEGLEKWEQRSYCQPIQLQPGMFDNNDGITLLQFEVGERLPRVCFVTPNHLEGSHWKAHHGKGPWTARQYLDFYYSKSEQAEWPEELREHMEKALTEIERLSRPMSKGQVGRLIPNVIGAEVEVSLA